MNRLTDRSALMANRARALRSGAADFLHRAALAEAQDRLAMVNRAFTEVAIVGGWMPCWQDAFPGAAHVEDGERLALAPGAHDLVIHAMALHWADDPVGQLVQARRALRPDGLMLAVAPGGRTLQELRAALAEAETAVLGGLSPRVLPMAEIRDLGGLLQRAGLSLPVADAVTLTANYQSAFHLMRDLRAMGEGNALANRYRRPAPRALFTQAAQRYDAAYAGSDGRITASFELIVLTGWAPDESQPKPLRPGSAAARLADALGAPDATPDVPISLKKGAERDPEPQQED
jgi:SAM-dependent methyltransferase